MNDRVLPRILFVDDEPNVLEALRRGLRPRAERWDMTFETSPAEAVERQRQRPFDVLVTDMRMPGMSGLELIQAFRSVHADTQCLILTGAADLEMALAAINEAHAFRFYTKPATIPRLVAGIDDALAAMERRPASDPAGLGLAMLDRLPLAVVVVDERGKAIFANAAGMRLASRRDGLVLSPEGAVRGGDSSVTHEVQRLVQAAVASGATNAMSLPRETSLRPLSLVVSPIVTAEGDTAAVLMISDPDQQVLPSEALVCKLFDLTSAEARLALALVREPTLEDAGAAVGVTSSTARSYLKRIFMKTGVSRQAELVRLILTAPVAVGQ